MNRVHKIGIVFAVIGCLAPGTVKSALGAEKLGKIVFKAGSPDSAGSEFADSGLADTVKDMKRRAGAFVVVDDEASADFLMVIVSREDTPVAGQQTAKRVTVNLSVKDGSSWRPGAKITKVTNAWGLSAAHVIGDAEKWIKANSKK